MSKAAAWRLRQMLHLHITHTFQTLTMADLDIRWEQRFSNFIKAFTKLEQAVQTYHDKSALPDADFSELEKEGMIQRFEYTHELAWNVMKDYAAYQGNSQLGGSRDATREAFKLQLIKNGEGWMDMLKARNQTSHTYDEATATEIFEQIIQDFYPLFTDFKHTMEEKRSGTQGNLFDKS
jgi:nucleotidyltransferase substrate binding protein (TIGR01987 family)